MRPLIGLLIACLLGPETPDHWTVQESGTKARLRGLSVVSEEVAWASGTGGTFVRTVDGGRIWTTGRVPDASDLDFRDLHAVDARTAYLLAAGPGDKSRIVKTVDGGATWTRLPINPDPKGFLDAIAFWDADHGLAFGDPVDGRFVIVTTDDGGKTWRPIAPEGMPPTLPGEGAFAASGTCLVVGDGGRAWFGTGGAKVARVFRSDDRGRTWTAHETPIRAGTPSSGIFSLSFSDANRGIAIGGDYKEPGRSADVVAQTSDGGRIWTRPAGPGPAGYRSALAAVPGTDGGSLIAVGPTGSDISTDGGKTWGPFGTRGFHAVGFGRSYGCWAVGDDGLVARLKGVLPRRR